MNEQNTELAWRLDPSLANEPIARAGHQSDRYCHQWDRSTSGNAHGSIAFGSMCGYPAIGRLADGSTACERHCRPAEGGDDRG